MSPYFVEKLCPQCRGQGCLHCNDTGAVEVQVDAKTFYNDKPRIMRAQSPLGSSGALSSSSSSSSSKQS